MGFFKDLKADLSQAVNELLPDDSFWGIEEEDEAVNTLDDEKLTNNEEEEQIAANQEGLKEQISKEEISLPKLEEEIVEKLDEATVAGIIENDKELEQKILAETLEEKVEPEIATETLEEEVEPEVSTETLEEEVEPEIATETLEEEVEPEIATETLEEEVEPEIATETLEEEVEPEIATEILEEEVEPEMATETLEEEVEPEMATEILEEEVEPEVSTETLEEEVESEIATEILQEELEKEVSADKVEEVLDNQFSEVEPDAAAQELVADSQEEVLEETEQADDGVKQLELEDFFGMTEEVAKETPAPILNMEEEKVEIEHEAMQDVLDIEENIIVKENKEENVMSNTQANNAKEDNNIDVELLAKMFEKKEETEKPKKSKTVKSNLAESQLQDEVTVITKGTTINGSISSDGSLEVKGTITGDVECLGKLNIVGAVSGNLKAAEIDINTPRLEGNVESAGDVKVGVGTIVIGDVSGKSAVIAGAVKGEVDVNGPVVVDSTAIIKGNINAKSVQINNGAVVDGYCSLSYASVDIDNFFDGDK